VADAICRHPEDHPGGHCGRLSPMPTPPRRRWLHCPSIYAIRHRLGNLSVSSGLYWDDGLQMPPLWHLVYALGRGNRALAPTLRTARQRSTGCDGRNLSQLLAGGTARTNCGPSSDKTATRGRSLIEKASSRLASLTPLVRVPAKMERRGQDSNLRTGCPATEFCKPVALSQLSHLSPNRRGTAQ
jgi:hypothetical protein